MSRRRHGSLSDNAEVDDAAKEAAKGAVAGAAKWGLAFGLIGAAGYVLSPIYRNLTVQFKVFIQMSGMTLGSMIEADRRLREYELRVRRMKKMAAIRRDEEAWGRLRESYEEDLKVLEGRRPVIVGDGSSSTEGKEG